MAKLSKKAIIILSFIGISIALVALIPTNIPPGIIDEPMLDEEIEITTILNKSDDLSIDEDASINEKTELDFYIDDKGIKHYVLNAVEELSPEG